MKNKNIFFSFKKSISPLVATILLIVVAVAIIVIVVSWGKGFTQDSFKDANKISTLAEASLSQLTYIQGSVTDEITLRNGSSDITENLTGYMLFSDNPEEYVFLNQVIPFQTTKNFRPNELIKFNLLCHPSEKFVLVLYTSNNEQLNIKINNGKPNIYSCEDYYIDRYSYVYTFSEITDMINTQDYIPITNIYDLNNIRFAESNTFGEGTSFEGTYTGGLDKKYLLLNDIDATETIEWNDGNGWYPLGFEQLIAEEAFSFTGVIDGGGYAIKNLYIYSYMFDFMELMILLEGDVNGLINYSASFMILLDSGEIKNLALENVDFTSSLFVSGFANAIINGAEISRSYVAGDLSGLFGSFGLTLSLSDGYISNSYSLATISTSDICVVVTGFVGEIVGDSTITNSYMSGLISGPEEASSGFIGFYYDGTISSSFWNTEISRQVNSIFDGSIAGVSGKTNSQMKQESTFLDWDFDVIWRIEEGSSFPYLRNINPSFVPTNDYLTPYLEYDYEEVEGILDINLYWENTSSTLPLGYEVYKNNEKISGETLITNFEYEDNGLDSGELHYWYVKAIYEDREIKSNYRYFYDFNMPV